MKAVLVDDEANNNESLQFLLNKYCPSVIVAGIAGDAREAEELIRKTKPDLVFLDIELPYGNGFDLLNKLSPVDFAVVFVTAFDSYALKAIRYAALDYLLKPVNIPELKEAVEKAALQHRQKRMDNQISNLLSNLSSGNTGSKKIALPSQEGISFEKADDIIYLSASSNYTLVHAVSGKKHLVSRTLRDFEELLPETLFCRIHHSFIVNINRIKKYYKGRGGYVEMEDGVTIEVSARKKDEFLARFS